MVLAKRIGQESETKRMVNFYFADRTSAQDYYPFGKEDDKETYSKD